MKSSKIFILVSIVTVTFFYSCSSYIIKENDISHLSPNFFDCDSVKSTPFYFQFKWSPKSNDSVSLKISGDVCSGIRLQSSWTKDSIITLELDTKRAGALSFEFLFALSEKCYNTNSTASINGYELINSDDIILKDSLLPVTKYIQKVYLPLFRYNTFVFQESTVYIKSMNDKMEIKSVPYFDEDITSEQPFTITDFLKINIDSDLPVAFYDKSINKIIGKEVISRANDFSKYQLCCTDNLTSSTIDTVSITYCKDNFVNKSQIFISKDSPSKKYVPTQIIANIGDGSTVYPGDTLDVSVAYIDSNGVKRKFNENTFFEAGLTSGCGTAIILSKDGEQKKYFRRIQAPIKLVILDYNDDDSNDNNIWIRVGINPADFIDCSED